jgi:hypothetical protein
LIIIGLMFYKENLFFKAQIPWGMPQPTLQPR